MQEMDARIIDKSCVVSISLLGVLYEEFVSLLTDRYVFLLHVLVSVSKGINKTMRNGSRPRQVGGRIE
jgi:hypothetical protein